MTLASWGFSAGGAENRTAEALFREVNGCVTTQTLITAIQNETPVNAQYPDGWARAAWVTVEQDDTCAGVQLLNAAGQLTATTEQLAIDRKLADAVVSGFITVWDGISQTQGQIAVVVNWVGLGAIDRSVWRTVQRRAEAILTADGFGLQLRNFTQQATIKITK